MKQLLNDATPESLATEVCRAAKLKTWHTYTGTINNKAVEVKVYGLWMQIFRINGIDYANPEFKTQKEMKAYIIESITPLIKTVAAIKKYCERGNGIYSTSHGGRYFDARISDSGELECYHGYENADNAGWLEMKGPLKWHGPNGENVVIFR